MLNSEWEPLTSYKSQVNNIVTEFFIPALERSTSYKRIAGLFSSNSFALCARGIKGLAANEGNMKLVISPILSKSDAKVLRESSENDFQNVISNSILNELDKIESKFEKDHVNALRVLLKEEFLEIRIHVPKDEKGNFLDAEQIIEQNMFSEKIGIFEDMEEKISFRGTVNANKDSWEKGVFSITVDVTWIPGQKKHVEDDEAEFDKIWNAENTFPISDFLKKEITKKSPKLTEINLEEHNVPDWAKLSNGKILWDNQIRAVNSWINNNHKGIFSIATAGGKTLASLAASTNVPENVLILIIVHGKSMVLQWEKEIRKFDKNGYLIICDSSHSHGDWRKRLGKVTGKFSDENEESDIGKRIYIIANDVTANNDQKIPGKPFGFLTFFEHVNKNRIMIIADEVHHLGASINQNILERIDAKYRLALSATFVRQWDVEGTNVIKNYFGGELEDAVFSVKEGIAKHRLSKYVYLPFFARLDEDEFEKYHKKTIDISIKNEQLKKDPNNSKLKKELTSDLNNRADIIKKARNKINAFAEIIKSKPNLPYIVFFDDYEQLEEFRDKFSETIEEINENISENDDIQSSNFLIFDGRKKDWEREIILKQTVEQKTPIFSMYCLDEGIDVPEFQGAILISSSSTNLQYVQRRGRILRLSGKGKIAQLYDIIVLPPEMESIITESTADSIIRKEINRVEEMADASLNSFIAKNTVKLELSKIGYDVII